jgi:XRE family aerobic/anaerobic benzoate catabolism transcriptional regulator
MTVPSSPTIDAADDRQALEHLGSAIRDLRHRLGFSRTELARRSGLSLRFLAQLESGEGNISYLRLRRLAQALSIDLGLLLERADRRIERPAVLLGMRGAGKSTVGGVLACNLGVPLLEIDEMVEREAGLALGQIFELQGESYYRQLERDALSRFLATGTRAILAAGGGIVTETETFALLRRHTFTIWLKASPQDHWDRVLAQGDRRPMRNRPDAMEELEQLWAARARSYSRADLVVQTSHRSVEEVVEEIELALPWSKRQSSGQPQQ